MKMNKLVSLLIVILISSSTNALFGSSLKKLKQKAKDAYKKKFGKDKTWHFLGHELTEYPGTNEKYRQINREKWDEYYACLMAQSDNITSQVTQTPEAIQGFESNTIRLECKLCLSPLESMKIDAIEWEFAPAFGKHFHPIDYSEHILLSPEDKTLRIYNLQKEHSGQYICRLDHVHTPLYFLTVVSTPDKELQQVHSSSAPIGPYPLQIQPIPGTNLVLDTEWGPWSTCSKCNEIGKKYKLGYCIVIIREQNKKRQIANTTNDQKIEIPKEDIEIVNIFKFGIPCKSHILPLSIRNLQLVRQRKNEIMNGYCKEKCPDDHIFEVRDRDGKVLERVNNSAGIYSSLQGVPPAEPSVERMLQFGKKGKKVIITCPGNLNSDAPLQWQIGTKKIIPELITSESKGRIYISITDKIHIKEAKISDSNIYSCWQHKELAGTVRLIVEKNFSLDFNHHLMLLGMIAVATIFLYVFIKAFFGRKVVRQGKK